MLGVVLAVEAFGAVLLVVLFGFDTVEEGLLLLLFGAGATLLFFGAGFALGAGFGAGLGATL